MSVLVQKNNALVTPRFIGTAITQKNTAFIYYGLSDLKVTQYYGRPLLSFNQVKEQMQWYAHLEDTKTGIWWCFSDLKTKKYVGAAGLQAIDKQQKTAEIGLWLVPEFWGQGIFPELCKAICQFGFDRLKLQSIHGYVFDNNLKCKKALEKTAFTFCYLLPEPEYHNGKSVKIALYKNNK